jgi:site-specific recombinase XerD
VLGKGNKERLIPVGRRSQEAIRAWVERFRSQFDAEGTEPRVFLNANGQRMTLRSLEEMIGRAGAQAGISGLHPHRLRHTFATRFLTLGLGDTFQLQQLLGHTSLEMVRRYVSLASIQRTIVENRPSGMDRLGWDSSNSNRRQQPNRRSRLRILG